MKTIIIFSVFLFIQIASLLAQTCESLDSSIIPITPYTNGYLYFDGSFDFARTRDAYDFEFNYGSTDSFYISVSLKILGSGTQYIMGKYYSSNSTGWILGYNTDSTGVRFYNGQAWRRVYNLTDTNWHKYEIKFSKADATLKTWVDGNLTFSYINYSYTSSTNIRAFGIGHAELSTSVGLNDINVSDKFFKGYIDELLIMRNGTKVGKYLFDEGAGEVVRDSTEWTISDRTYPGDSITYIGEHLQLGYGPGPDTCDAKWITDSRTNTTKYSDLSGGFLFYAPLTFGIGESFSLGLTVYNGNLINTGTFNRINGSLTDTAYSIAQWNGSSWSKVGNGFNAEGVYATTWNNKLIVTGHFTQVNPSTTVNYIAQWDGSSWSALGTGFNSNSVGYVLVTFGNDLIAGGNFTTAGGTTVNRIARWDGTSWNALGSGCNGNVWALSVFHNSLYVGGSFSTAGGITCNGIAMWDGTNWSSVGDGISGNDGVIYVLYDNNDTLFAGGSFANMNGVTVNNICRYDPNAWQSVGSGTTGFAGHVIDMVRFDNKLYVCGSFLTMDGKKANKIASYYNGVWCPLGFGIDLRPEDLEVFNGSLIINGDLYSSDGVKYNNIVKYTP